MTLDAVPYTFYALFLGYAVSVMINLIMSTGFTLKISAAVSIFFQKHI